MCLEDYTLLRHGNYRDLVEVDLLHNTSIAMARFCTAIQRKCLFLFNLHKKPDAGKKLFVESYIEAFCLELAWGKKNQNLWK
jgi:hypothetical protein